jgi:thiamine pyrophosphokinase
MEGSQRRVLGVLAGADFAPDRLAAWALSADLVLAADGGADRLLALGITPFATIGDFDSVVAKEGLGRVVRDVSQDTSDCDKLLHFAAENGVSDITLVGAEGDRLDHVLGTLYSTVRSPLRIRLALRRGLGWILVGPVAQAVPTAPDESVSLLPLSECSAVNLTGVKWPFQGQILAATGLVSLSNRATGSRIDIAIGSGAALLTVLSPRLELPSW